MNVFFLCATCTDCSYHTTTLQGSAPGGSPLHILPLTFLGLYTEWYKMYSYTGPTVWVIKITTTDENLDDRPRFLFLNMQNASD